MWCLPLWGRAEWSGEKNETIYPCCIRRTPSEWTVRWERNLSLWVSGYLNADMFFLAYILIFVPQSRDHWQAIWPLRSHYSNQTAWDRMSHRVSPKKPAFVRRDWSETGRKGGKKKTKKQSKWGGTWLQRKALDLEVMKIPETQQRGDWNEEIISLRNQQRPNLWWFIIQRQQKLYGGVQSKDSHSSRQDTSFCEPLGGLFGGPDLKKDYYSLLCKWQKCFDSWPLDHLWTGL